MSETRELRVIDRDEKPKGPIRPTPERLAKGDDIIIPATDRHNPQDRPALVVRQTSLDRYKARPGTLQPHQLEAALRYQGQTARSLRFASPTMRFQGRVNGGCPEMQDQIIAAGVARDRALTHIKALTNDHGEPVGLDYASILDHVCVEGLAAEGWAIHRKLHPMKGIKTLRLALDALAKHYGIRVV